MYQLNQILFLRKNFGVVSVALRLMPILGRIVLRLAFGKDRLTQSRARLAAVVEGVRYKLTSLKVQAMRSDA